MYRGSIPSVFKQVGLSVHNSFVYTATPECCIKGTFDLPFFEKIIDALTCPSPVLLFVQKSLLLAVL